MPLACKWVLRDHCQSVVRMQVACGSGLVRIYDFLRRDEPSQYPGVDLSRELDPAGVSKAAVDGSNPVACERVAEPGLAGQGRRSI